MQPEEVGYITDLDSIFAKALKNVNDAEAFGTFLKEWNYWLDEETKKLTGDDWQSMKPLIDDCRKNGIEPEDKHLPAMALLMPEKIFRVGIIAHEFGAPWGCAYIRMKEQGVIDF